MILSSSSEVPRHFSHRKNFAGSGGHFQNSTKTAGDPWESTWTTLGTKCLVDGELRKRVSLLQSSQLEIKILLKGTKLVFISDSRHCHFRLYEQLLPIMHTLYPHPRRAFFRP